MDIQLEHFLSFLCVVLYLYPHDARAIPQRDGFFVAFQH